MPSDPLWPQRRSIRLPGYDYAGIAAFFVTILVQHRAPILCTIASGGVALTPFGRSVLATWHALPQRHPHVTLDAFVVMPDHVHGILVLQPPLRTTKRPQPRRHGLGEIVRGFKSHTGREINIARGTPGRRVWQRNYYERIIRDADQLWATRRYIEQNPAKWWAQRQGGPERGDAERGNAERGRGAS